MASSASHSLFWNAFTVLTRVTDFSQSDGPSFSNRNSKDKGTRRHYFGILAHCQILKKFSSDLTMLNLGKDKLWECEKIPNWHESKKLVEES